MKKVTILPADTYTVINKTIINDNDKKIITSLYQPIIGYTATSLYFTLIDDLDQLQIMSGEMTHHHLMSTMQLKLEDIVIAREKLEAAGLLKSYIKKGNINHYVYLLFSPISPNEFFNHPILNIVLYNNIGKKEYDKIINYYKIPKISLKDYDEITSSFDDVFTPVVKTHIDINEDIFKKNTNKITINDNIDYNMLISSIPNNMYNEKCFNKETKELINSLSYIYNLNTIEMQGLVRDALNEKGLIDKTILRKAARDYYQFENSGKLPTLIYNKQPEFLKKPEGDNSKWAKMVYTFENLTPYQLLKAKYKGAEPTDRDKKLVESLLIDQKLNPGVINVLISYVLKINNQQLKKSYVETIAGQWKRLNVETVEEAMKITEKEHKKLRKIVKTPKPVLKTTKKNDNPLPAWFDKELEKTEVTKEESEELDKILNELI